jgi:HPt (histidine-containing phosphotransfer) domain-containing protein
LIEESIVTHPAYDLAEAVSEMVEEILPSPCPEAGTGRHPVELDRLREICCGDQEFERELIQVFLSDSMDRIRSLESALQEDNVEIFRIQAHSIKGASANAGAERMTEIARCMEQADQEGNPGDVFRLLEDLKGEYDRVRAFLTRHLDMDLPSLEGSA